MTIHRALRRVRRQDFLHTQVIFHLAMVLLNQWVTCLVIEQDEERAQYQLIIGSGILTSSQEIGIGKPACLTDSQTKGINKRCAEPPIVMKLAGNLSCQVRTSLSWHTVQTLTSHRFTVRATWPGWKRKGSH